VELLRKHQTAALVPARSVRPAVPLGVSQTIDRMMAKDPGMRIQSAEDLCKMIDARCSGRRDIVDELGLHKEDQPKPMWEMKVLVNGRPEKRRLSMEDVQERYKKGQVTSETPTRRVGMHGKYQPAREFLELDRQVFRDYSLAPRNRETNRARKKLSDLVSNYDDAEKKYKRRRWLKGAQLWLVHAAILLVLLGLAYFFWPHVRSLVATEEAPPESSETAEQR
jgi:hypothetical protein